MLIINKTAVFSLFAMARPTGQRVANDNKVGIDDFAVNFQAAEGTAMVAGRATVTNLATASIDVAGWVKTSGTGTVVDIDGKDFEGNPVTGNTVHALLIRLQEDSDGNGSINTFDGGQIIMQPGACFMIAGPSPLPGDIGQSNPILLQASGAHQCIFELVALVG